MIVGTGHRRVIAIWATDVSSFMILPREGREKHDRHQEKGQSHRRQKVKARAKIKIVLSRLSQQGDPPLEKQAFLYVLSGCEANATSQKDNATSHTQALVETGEKESVQKGRTVPLGT